MCAVLLPAIAVEDKLGAEEVGGREYWWDPDDRDKHIRVPRSNAPKPHWEGERKTIWGCHRDRTHPPTVNCLALMKMMLMTILTIASMELPSHPPQHA